MTTIEKVLHTIINNQVARPAMGDAKEITLEKIVDYTDRGWYTVSRQFACGTIEIQDRSMHGRVQFLYVKLAQ